MLSAESFPLAQQRKEESARVCKVNPLQMQKNSEHITGDFTKKQVPKQPHRTNSVYLQSETSPLNTSLLFLHFLHFDSFNN